MIKQVTPIKRNGQPKDIADVVQFLASDGARFVTGTEFLVDATWSTILENGIMVFRMSARELNVHKRL